MMKTRLLLAQIPSSQKEKAEIHRQEAAEVRRRLLQAGMREAGIPITQADRIERSPDGKPRLSGYPAFHFNLSHSGDYIACIFSAQEIGLDLQEHRRPAGSADSCLRIARRFFTDREYAALKTLQEQQALGAGPGGDHPLRIDPGGHFSGPEDPVIRLFSHLWVLKEAYLKYIGCGLRGSMDSFYPLPLPESGTCPDPGSLFSPASFGHRQVASTRRADTSSFGHLLSTSETADTSSFGHRQSASETAGTSSFGHLQSASETADTPFRQPSDPLFFPMPQFRLQGVRGKVQVLKDTALFHPADYALLPAPEGYSLAVCAEKLPEEICMRTIR